MGSKGQTTTTNQSQSYTPAAQAQGAISGALNQAQTTAGLPFNIPQAPVAGFSPQQQRAFDIIGGAQGQAQPYYDQAQGYFNHAAQGPDISQFFNPYAGAVTANLKDIFGQQQAQQTGQLTQAAGGVGADRIGVGQSELAKQQGLTAGQTLSQLYAPSLSAAQQQQNMLMNAGYGTASLGSASQNAAFQGANQLLGTGGLQQQLSQAQMNSPYQQALAQAAFPYQQSQFLTGAVGALAPGLGGTTQGQGSQTSPGPSIWSQLIGAGTAGAGIYGGFNKSGGGSGAGNTGTGDGSWYGPSSVGGAPLAARGGAINSYAEGGAPNPYALDDGMAADQPIDVSQHSIIPTGHFAPMQPHIPQLNLNPPAAPQQSGIGGSGVSAGDIAKMAMMFAQRGGRINPYAEGGGVDNSIDVAGEEFPGGLLDVMHNLRAARDTKEVVSGERFSDNGSRIPGRLKARNDNYMERLKTRKYAQGGPTPPPKPLFDDLEEGMAAQLGRRPGGNVVPVLPRRRAEGGSIEDRFDPVKEAIASGDFDPAGANSTTFEGRPAMSEANRGITPMPRRRPALADARVMAADDSGGPMKFSDDSTPAAFPYAPPARGLKATVGDGGPRAAPNPYAPTAAAPEESNTVSDFQKSPWAALTAAGLGMMAGTSPFAGVNIGQGGLQGMKTLAAQREAAQKDTTIAQSAKRLAQEAKFHEDQFTRKTMGQQIQEEQGNRPYEELTAIERENVARNRERDKLARDQFERPYNELTKAEQETVNQSKTRNDLAERQFNRPYKELTKMEQTQVDETARKNKIEETKPVKLGTDRNGFDIMGVRDPDNPGRFNDAVTGKPIDSSRVRAAQSAAEPDGTIPANTATVAAGAYNYSEGAPAVEKGMDVPEPAAVGGHSGRSLQTDAEYYLQTGKLPPGPRGGKSPTAIAQNDYVNAVRNYAGSLATSRGLTPEQTADMWRTAPGMLRFILGQDGRSTVALGTAVRHLDTLKQYADAWKANDTQTINRLRAAISREFGSDAATNLESAGKIVGPEIIKALGVAGAGTSDERQGASGQFSAIKSPDQMAGAIGVTQRLLGGQLEGRRRQAMNAGLTEDRFKNLIGERPFEVLSNIDKPGASTPAGKTIARQGTVSSGPNAGKKVIEYSDGTKEYQ